MAETETRRSDTAEDKLYTLSEISQKSGISMPTLQRYKKLYQARIPSVGKGRKQRYPDSALPVFDEIKNENVGRRGRPRKDASAPRPEKQPVASKRRPGRPAKAAPAAPVAAKRAGGRKAAAPAPPVAAPRRGRPRKNAAPAAPARGGRAQKSGGLLTLTQISETTGISYPTLVRYVRLYSDRLPHEGKGRARRFYQEAVDVFRQLRSESGRGGRKKGPGRPPGRRPGRPAKQGVVSDLSNAVAQRMKAIEKGQQSLEKKLKGLVKSLQKLFR
ncbi:MAG TPA: helix-turn-helix domain-containing protein [Thermoanaerobaculia bacterium]|nr:helix-turn-helix domain-containing protein [Thermoanaerobaculia bacterium]